jgi:hypothetical protein
MKAAEDGAQIRCAPSSTWANCVMALCWTWLNQICEPHHARSVKATSGGGLVAGQNETPKKALRDGALEWRFCRYFPHTQT